jgi:alginate O-acetyltransferase complex protein AlgJ
MPIKRKYMISLPVLAFAILLMAGFVVSFLSLKAVPDEDWIELKKPDNILSGESTRRFTKLLNKHFVLGSTFNQIERGMLWNLTGDLGPGVRAGCPEWLFLADELTLHPDRNKSAEFRAALAVQLANRLNERGIRLLVAVVPDKTRIESAHLCGLRRSALFDKRVVNWLALLQPQGVETLDMTAVLDSTPGERYYRTDTHWNETGAYAVAQTVATRLGELKWAVPAAGATLPEAVRIERSGDLVHLAGLDGLPGFLRPAMEMVQATKVAPITVESDDLFGDAGLPAIALIGTSYSRNSNFVPFLEHKLGEPVANLAKDGGNFSGAAIAFFAGATFRDNPPRTIVWEIPERVIEMPINDAERQWLEALSKGKL